MHGYCVKSKRYKTLRKLYESKAQDGEMHEHSSRPILFVYIDVCKYKKNISQENPTGFIFW